MLLRILIFLKTKIQIASGDLISIGFAGSSVKNVVSIIGAVEKVEGVNGEKILNLPTV